MKKEGTTYDDAAAIKKGNRKIGAGEVAVGAAAVSSAKSGIDMANVAALGAGASRETLAATTLGAAGAGLGIAAGAVMVAQGAWRGADAFRKVCRLQWGRAQTMLTARGSVWKRYVTNREATKVAINATKVALGALGIGAKIYNARQKDEARKKIQAGTPPTDAVDSDSFMAELNRVEAAQKKGKRANPTSKASKGDGSVDHAVNDYNRRQAIESASEVAQRQGTHRRLADPRVDQRQRGGGDLGVGPRSDRDEAHTRRFDVMAASS